METNYGNKNLIYVVILVFGLAVFAVAGAIVYKASKGSASTQNQATSDNTNQNSSGGQRGQGARGNFKPLTGTVREIKDQTIVMRTSDNQTKNIICSSSTRISKQANGQMTTLTLSDIKSGDKINVMSQDTTRSDIQARMIIIGDFTPSARGQNRTGGGSWNGGSSQQDPSGYQGADSNSSSSI